MMKWEDGASYLGQWQDGKACGYGKFSHVNGDCYLGQWYNDKANGMGIFVKKDDQDLKGGNLV